MRKWIQAPWQTQQSLDLQLWYHQHGVCLAKWNLQEIYWCKWRGFSHAHSPFQCVFYYLPCTVLNSKFSTVLSVSLWLSRVIATMHETGNGVTVGRGNPEIGWTSIKHDGESLRRRTKLDITVVLQTLASDDPHLTMYIILLTWAFM